MAVVYNDIEFTVKGQTLAPVGAVRIPSGLRGNRNRLRLTFDNDPWREYRGGTSATAKRQIRIVAERDGITRTDAVNTAMWPIGADTHAFNVVATYNAKTGVFTNEIFELFQTPGIVWLSVYGIDKNGEDVRRLTTNRVMLVIDDSLSY